MTGRILTPAEATSLQTALNLHGARLVVDGHYGELSHLALIKFQHDNGLPETGVPDFATTEKLGIPAIVTSPPPASKPNIFSKLATIGDLLSLLKGHAMTSDQITGLVRLALGLISGFFITKGIGDASLWNWIIGGILAVIPGAWSWYSNRPKVILSIADKKAAGG